MWAGVCGGLWGFVGVCGGGIVTHHARPEVEPLVLRNSAIVRLCSDVIDGLLVDRA